jgi:hypothetical protein
MPDLDATALRLEVGKRFCSSLALDEKSGPRAAGSLMPAKGQPLIAQAVKLGVGSRLTTQPLRATGRREPLRRPL